MADEATKDVSVARAVRNIQEMKVRTAKVLDSLETETGEVSSSAPAPQGTTAEQARQSEHTGTEGERAFGTPTSEPAEPKSREQIEAERKKLMENLNLKQTTDGANSSGFL